MRKPLTEEQDAFGHALIDYMNEKQGSEIIERSDGHIDLSAGGDVYFATPSGTQVDIVHRARGRILDIGCGAGRYALYLQERGHDVVGIDASPLAVEICRRRGLKEAYALTLEQITPSLGSFDTVLMLGNNFGLFGNRISAKRLLKRLRGVLAAGGQILAETMDPYQTTDPSHLAYHVWNLEKGRMGGQIRMRVRYKSYRTPWFDYLFVSSKELEEIVAGTGWRVAEEVSVGGPNYVAVLELA